jgi:radical SAM superfamily enzyme YgiQ (UPF0313 family)
VEAGNIKTYVNNTYSKNISTNKFTISFVQPNFRQGPGGIAAYLPYSCGLLWSHAQTNKIVRDSFVLDNLIYSRENIKDIALKLITNDVIAFSTYVWNKNYNFSLAKLLKKLNPNILIIFGGPDLPITNKNIFNENAPFIDIVVKGEGEHIFTSILQSYVTEKHYISIKGILINENGVCIDTGSGDRIHDLDQVPSPYLTGVFDKILPLENEWNGTLETNRGCPYKCTFCDWGSLTYSKVKKFSLERVFCELEWMGKNKIGYLDVADANFGIFIERDNMIVDKLIEVQQKTGYPYRTGWSWAKNQQSEVVQIAKKLITSGHFNNGLTISLQSLSEDTLNAIKRNNMGINKINEIFNECKKDGIPLNVELIVGLPGETFDSWEDTLYGVFEVGQHDSIEVWQAQILENSEMNLSQKDEYGIIGQMVFDYFPNSIDDEAPEFSQIVVQTSTMTLNEMVEAYKLSWFLITWHTGGFSQYIARFIRKHLNVSYKDFYTDFRKFLQADEFWSSEENYMSEIITNWYTHGTEIKTKLGAVTITASTNQYKTIFSVHHEHMYEHMFNLIERFANKYKIKTEIKKDLFLLNRSLIVKQHEIKNHKIKLKHNLFDFINSESVNLKKIDNEILVEFTHDQIKSKDVAWFIESIFFARRRSYGKYFLKNS